jgi:hypothetical protein
MKTFKKTRLGESSEEVIKKAKDHQRNGFPIRLRSVGTGEFCWDIHNGKLMRIINSVLYREAKESEIREIESDFQKDFVTFDIKIGGKWQTIHNAGGSSYK